MDLRRTASEASHTASKPSLRYEFMNRWASPGHRLLNESTGQLLALSGW